jgi:hypothetical protein
MDIEKQEKNTTTKHTKTNKPMKQLDILLMIIVTWLIGFITGYLKAKNK